MSLDRLGNKKLQKQGTESSNQTFDQKTHELLQKILTELRMLNVMYREATDIDVEDTDINGEF